MEKIVDETITATLLDLIRRKHITLDYSGTDMSSSLSSFTLVLNDKPEDKLKEYESYFMSYIFSTIGDGKKVTTKEIEGYGSISESKAKSFQSFLKAFSLSAKKEARSKKYFESGMENNKKAILLANIVPIVFIGIALMLYATYNISILVPVLIAVAAMILYSVYVNSIKKRSIEGNELYAKWKAFRNFLTSFGNMEDYPIPGIIVWEHYLVYATILGVADQVMKQLRVKIVETDIDESQTTYFTRGFYRNRYWGIHHSFSSSFRVAKMNAQSKIVEARNARSSSGGFGGGFGGGSSFGGGGGGGRSR
jgi:uncharacterized membrane protein